MIEEIIYYTTDKYDIVIMQNFCQKVGFKLFFFLMWNMFCWFLESNHKQFTLIFFIWRYPNYEY